MISNEIKSREIKRIHQAKRNCMAGEKAPENWSTQHLPYSDKKIEKKKGDDFNTDSKNTN